MGWNREETWSVTAVAGAALLLLVPLGMVVFPALPDYPAHLASYDLIATGARAPAVAGYYGIEWAFIPNLAGEIVVPALSHVVGLYTAARLFLGAALAMWALGPALVHRALFGRYGVAPVFAAFFACNANLSWGFLNFYFAMGCGLLVIAAWIATAERRSAPILLGFSLLVTAVYFSHLFAAATLLLILGCFEAGEFYRCPGRKDFVRRFGSLAVVFAPALSAYLFLKPRGAESGIAFDLADRALDKLGAAIEFRFDDPSYVLLGLLAVLLATGLWQGWIAMHRRMALPLAALALAALLAPEWALGGWGVDLRLPGVVGALVFASVEFRLERRKQLVLATAALCVLAAETMAQARDWRSYDARASELRAALRQLPPGKRILTVLDGNAIGYGADQPYWHMAELAIIDPGAFTPLMFTTRDQHVIRLRPQVARIAANSAEQGSPPDIDELNDLAAGRIDDDEDIAQVFPYLMKFQCHFDEAVVIHLGGVRSAVPSMLRLRRSGSFFAIYDIVPDSRCGA